MRFVNFNSAAAFARRFAQRVDGSARIRRHGDYWTVELVRAVDVLYDPEIEAVQRAEGRARFLAEIEETIDHWRACRGPF